MKKKGMLVIISGPSGSGKDTIIKNLDLNKYSLSISMTTRKKREEEVDGKDYFFCTKEEFIKKRDENQFLEHAQFCDNLYGTPKFYVEDQMSKGKIVILEIDVEGALQVKQKFQECVLIFLMPPTMKELKKRLIRRNTENKVDIEKRLKKAENEIKFVYHYDYLIINNKIDEVVKNIDKVLDVEYLKPCRNLYTIENFKQI